MGTLAMFVETNPSFYMAFLFLLLTSLTAPQGLSLQEMQPWSTNCSQDGFFDVIIQQLATISTLVGELSFWWSFSSGGGVLLHTASALPSGGDFFSLTTAAVLTCPLW